MAPPAVGWQVMLDGLEITQFTYFQQAGGLDLMPYLWGDHIRVGTHCNVFERCRERL